MSADRDHISADQPDNAGSPSDAEQGVPVAEAERPGVELIFGLVGAVGTNLRRVSQELEQGLRAYGYEPEVVRISKAIASLPPFAAQLNGRKIYEDERIDLLMTFGDQLRAGTESGDSAAMLAVDMIADLREQKYRDAQRFQRRAFILHSLKHPGEIDKLREIYGGAFFVISTHSPKEKRVRSLCERFAADHGSFQLDGYTEKAIPLVKRDEKTVGNDFGQNVRECFPKADLFLSESGDTAKQITRFLRILFSDPFQPPTIDEFGQFFAKAAALRSSDLSRQVGAVLTTKAGDVLATGCNEVPHSNGGYIWPDDVPEEKDYRDFRLGRDANAVMKSELFTEIYETLIKAGWFSDEVKDKGVDELLQDSLYKQGAILKEARAANIIEFGRIVHAEMAAITDAARLGMGTKGATLYCTTFPCHMCARHIIAAGIDRVVYIEPYPKSMTKDLYQRAVQVEGEEADDDAVRFTPFAGVSPDRFIELFQMTQRKDKRGYVVDWDPLRAKIKVKISPFLEREIFFLRRHHAKLRVFLKRHEESAGGVV